MATTPFEQKFGILANDKLSDVMPGLEDDSLGFQVVSSEDDDTRAFGVQAYDIGRHLVLVPMFWLKGKIEGGEVMFVKDLKRFLPLTEVEVNNLKSGKTFSMGDLSNEKEKNKGTAYRVSTMELNWLNSKRAGEVSVIDKEDILEMFRVTDGRPVQFSDISLFGPKAAADFSNAMVRNPKLANALLSVHTPEEIKGALMPSIEKGVLIQKVASVQRPRALRFIDDPFSKEAADLPDDLKKVLMRDGIVAIDNRKEASVALKERKGVLRWGTPPCNGRYDVIMRDGSTVKGDIVSCGHSSLDCDGGPVPMCSDEPWRASTRQGGASSVMVFIGGKVSVRPSLDVCVDTKSGNDNEVGSKVTVQNLRAHAGKKDGRYWREGKDFPLNRVLIYDGKHATSYYGSLETVDTEIVFNPYYGNSNRNMRIVLTGKPGAMFDKAGVLYIPESSKIVFMEDYKNDDNAVVKPSDIASEALVGNGMETVKVSSDGRNWRVDDSRGGTQLVGFKESLRYLMQSTGLREKQARDIMEDARSKSYGGQLGEPVSFWCKCAWDDPLDPTNDPWFGVGDDHTITREAGLIGGPLDAAAVGRISEASKTGVKEIVDTQVMSELAKTAYSVDKAQDYLPVLAKALDRICRALVLFYWHNDEFEERYGKQNMPQLEDALKENIRSLGDLMGYLKDKSVQDEVGSDDDETDDLGQEMA